MTISVSQNTARQGLSNAWAILPNRILYKKESSIPDHLNQQLHLMTGLFEIGDNLWQESIARREYIQKQIEGDLDNANFNHPINTETLDIFLKSCEFERIGQVLIKEFGTEVNGDVDHDDCISPFVYFQSIYSKALS